MSRFQSLIATWLILTLATSGVVGISPIVHHWVEHRGQGTPHVHWITGGRHPHHTRAVARATPSGDIHSHSHPHSAVSKAGAAAVPFTHNHAPFELPRIDLGMLRELLARLFQEASGASLGEPGDNPDHDHHSVFQLVAGGLIDRASATALQRPSRIAGLGGTMRQPCSSRRRELAASSLAEASAPCLLWPSWVLRGLAATHNGVTPEWCRPRPFPTCHRPSSGPFAGQPPPTLPRQRVLNRIKAPKP